MEHICNQLCRYNFWDGCKVNEMNGVCPLSNVSELFGKTEQLKNAISDVVPVVRCKDCEHAQFMSSCSMYLCRCTGGKLRYADNYCNYGERKEQE